MVSKLRIIWKRTRINEPRKLVWVTICLALKLDLTRPKLSKLNRMGRRAFAVHPVEGRHRAGAVALHVEPTPDQRVAATMLQIVAWRLDSPTFQSQHHTSYISAVVSQRPSKKASTGKTTYGCVAI